MRIICCITDGIGTYSDCYEDGCTGDEKDDRMFSHGVDDNGLGDGGNDDMGKVIASGAIDTCGSAGSNCTRMCEISP